MSASTEPPQREAMTVDSALTTTVVERKSGETPIKPEFLIHDARVKSAPAPDDDAAESGTKSRPDARDTATAADGSTPVDAEGNEPPTKKLKGAARKKAARAAAEGGSMNKGRKFKRIEDLAGRGVCHSFVRSGLCAKGAQCKFSHDLKGYLIDKEPDVNFPAPPSPSTGAVDGTTMKMDQTAKEAYLDSLYGINEPFVKFTRCEAAPAKDATAAATNAEDAPQPVAKDVKHSLGDTWCPAHAGFAAVGGGALNGCPAGWQCRFLGAHVVLDEGLPEQEGVMGGPAGIRIKRVQEDMVPHVNDRPLNAPDETNFSKPDRLKLLSRKKYPLPLTKVILPLLESEIGKNGESTLASGPLLFDRAAARASWDAAETAATAAASAALLRKGPTKASEIDFEAMENSSIAAAPTAPAANSSEKRVDGSTQSAEGSLDYARIRPPEKRRLNWKHGELYLAPLTTVGNLPFRRLASNLGADITCGEMALADAFLTGSSREWSLVRRWEGERCFGTQIAGSKPALLVPVAEALATEFGEGLDFVDINCGCPIDLVFNKGAGSALMDATGRLSRILRGCSAALGETPLTIKLRTGTTTKRNAHKLFPRLQTEWGVGAATLHGRTRKQRYKHEADWTYIRECTDALRESVREANESHKTADMEDLPTIPLYGNGDVYDWRDYDRDLEISGVDGTMIARGGLIKPWLFTEIKEKRDWDISSRERLDLVRQFASFGLTHWGSDTQGVNTTRRYLCEWLSFTSRYTPVGLLSHLPAKLNDRPPAYVGRNDLETLLASTDARDWVKISEMFLGKSPEDFTFIPKHKSSSYDAAEEQQG